jgi:hypothetical protein
MNDSLFRTQQFQKLGETYLSSSDAIPVLDGSKKMELCSPENGILDRDKQVEVWPASNCAAQLTHPTEITSCPS